MKATEKSRPRIVALSGSLRARSSNGALLREAARLAAGELEFIFYEKLAELPHFNPDLDEEGAIAPAPVAELRALLASVDGAAISCPEYMSSLPGSFKNALDWIVSSNSLGGKPVLLLNAAPMGAENAQRQLAQILTMIDARVLDASLTAPFLARKLASDGTLDDDTAERRLRAALSALAAAARAE